jgi:hypothetical protein
MTAESTAASQEPGGTDSPIVIEFGVAQSEPDVDLSAGGLVTFNTAGTYRITLMTHYGRTGAGGVAILFLRGRLNGAQYMPSESVQVDNSQIVIPSVVSFDLVVNAADTFDMQIYRDSAGTNAGGLFKTSSTLGWDDAPSAFMAIRKRAI